VTPTPTPDPARSCTAATLGAAPPAPQPAGTAVALTAGADCAAEYRFWVWRPATGWAMVRDYDADPTYAWDTAGLAPDYYEVGVWVRKAGTTALFDATAVAGYTLAGR
jgi:hypothetical protein